MYEYIDSKTAVPSHTSPSVNCCAFHLHQVGIVEADCSERIPLDSMMRSMNGRMASFVKWYLYKEEKKGVMGGRRGKNPNNFDKKSAWQIRGCGLEDISLSIERSFRSLMRLKICIRSLLRVGLQNGQNEQSICPWSNLEQCKTLFRLSSRKPARRKQRRTHE